MIYSGPISRHLQCYPRGHSGGHSVCQLVPMLSGRMYSWTQKFVVHTYIHTVQMGDVRLSPTGLLTQDQHICWSCFDCDCIFNPRTFLPSFLFPTDDSTFGCDCIFKRPPSLGSPTDERTFDYDCSCRLGLLHPSLPPSHPPSPTSLPPSLR